MTANTVISAENARLETMGTDKVKYSAVEKLKDNSGQYGL